MDCRIKLENYDDQEEEEIDDIFSNEDDWALEKDPLAPDVDVKSIKNENEEIENIYSDSDYSRSLQKDPLALDVDVMCIKKENEVLCSEFISVNGIQEILKNEELIIKDEKIAFEENECSHFEMETLETQSLESDNDVEYHSKVMPVSNDESNVSVEDIDLSETTSVSSPFKGEIAQVQHNTVVPSLSDLHQRPIAKRIVHSGLLANPTLYVKNLQKEVDSYERLVLNLCRKAFGLERKILRRKPSKLTLKKWLHLRFFRH